MSATPSRPSPADSWSLPAPADTRSPHGPACRSRRGRAATGGALAALVLSAGLLAGAPPVGGAPTTPTAPAAAAAPRAAGALPSVGTNFADPGPFQVTVQRESEHTYYSPTNLGEGGITHPVILWGNGTGTTPSSYDPFLRHLASHGFVVAAANTTSAGNGQAMLAGLDNLTRFNGEAGNRFQGRLDLEHVGTTGHSQGGGGAMNAAHDARVDTTFPLEPGFGTARGIVGSALYFAGQNDAIVSPALVRSAYNGSSGIPAAYAELAGASHFTAVGNVGGFRGPATAWARWQLAGDTAGAPLFTGANPGLASSPEWSVYEANARLTADTGPDPSPNPTTPPDPTDPTTPTPTTPPTTERPSWGSWWRWWLDRIRNR